MNPLNRRPVALASALFVAGLLAACSSDKKTKVVPPPQETYLDFCQLPTSCQQIAQACHPKDDGSPGPIHDCHVIGHEVGTVAACAPKLTSCLTTCNDAEALSDGPAENLYAACEDAGADSGAHP